MPLALNMPSALSRRSRGGRIVGHLATQALVSVAGAVLTTMFVRYAVSASERGAIAAEVSLESAWNTNIARLGIEPVYPPQEDIAVGDLFAVVTADDEREHANVNARAGAGSAFLSRAVKLGHVPVTQALESVYSDIPFFGQSAAADDGATPSASVAPAPTPAPAPAGPPVGSFGQDRWYRTLPRAAFPGLAITHTGRASGGFALPNAAAFEAGAGASMAQKLELRNVQTYGLPSAAASAALRQFCDGPGAGDVCDPEAARRSLGAVEGLGERIQVKLRNPNTGRDYYAVAIKMFMISRVYMAREVVEEWSLVNAQGDAAAVGRGTGATLDASNSAVREAGGSADAKVDATRNLMADKVRDAKGGLALSYAVNNGQVQVMHEKFPRPIAIGFRSIQYEPPTEVDVAANARPAYRVGARSMLPFDPSRCTVFIHAGNAPGSSSHSGIADDLANELARLGYVVRAPDQKRDVVGGPGVDYFSDRDLKCARHVAATGKAMMNVTGAPATGGPADGEAAFAPRRQHDRNVDGHIGVWLF